MQVHLCDSLRWPNMEKFDGTLDPNAHVKAYFTQINLLMGDKRNQCRLFPTSLKSETLEWYYSLPANLLCKVHNPVCR